MPVRLSEKYVRDLPFGSGAVRDTEVKGLMVVCNQRSKSYCVQGDLWRSKRFVKAVRASIGRTDRVALREARVRARELMAQIARGEDPKHQSYGSFVSFSDPDGNTWIVQEVTVRLPGRVATAQSGKSPPA